MRKIRDALLFVGGFSATVGASYLLFGDGNMDVLGDKPKKLDEVIINDTARTAFTSTMGNLILRDRVIAMYFESLDAGEFRDGKVRVPQKTSGNGFAGVWAILNEKLERDVKFGDECLGEEYSTDGIVSVSPQDIMANPNNPNGIVLQFTVDTFGIPVPANEQTEGSLEALGCDTHY